MWSLVREYFGAEPESASFWVDDRLDIGPSVREHLLEIEATASELKHLLPWHHDETREFEYSSVPAPGIIITGVRSVCRYTDDVVVTASSVADGITGAALYRGSLQDLASASASDWHVLTPDFAGQTVTSSTFYGPNTPRFDPEIGGGNVRAVGSYKYAEDVTAPNSDHGMMYEGPIDGVGGQWTQLDATPLVGPDETLLNTIAHSTMGDLVVGNYDTSLATGRAFIYDIEEEQWLDMNPAGSLSVTAYGIWHNARVDNSSYTIAGGYSDLNRAGLDAGYLVNYDSETDTFSDFTEFQFDNRPAGTLISHFDGITRTKGGYNLTGDFVRDGVAGAFFAHVDRLRDGSFGDAEWTEIAFPGEDVSATSGNTVIDNTVLGIYVADGEPNSFFASAVDTGHGWDC
jgi:hypothetical protein